MVEHVLIHVQLDTGVTQTPTNVKIVTLHVIHVLMHQQLVVHLVLPQDTSMPLPMNVKPLVMLANMEILHLGHANLVFIHVPPVLQLMSVPNVIILPDMLYIMDNVSLHAQMDIMIMLESVQLVIQVVTLVPVVMLIVVILAKQHPINTYTKTLVVHAQVVGTLTQKIMSVKSVTHHV